MLFRKMLRTVIRYKAQFFSMIIMIAIGTGMFMGFNMEWLSLEKDTKAFFQETDFADYRITAKDSFSKKDAERLIEMFNEYAGAPDMTIRWDASGTYAYTFKNVYQLADGSLMVLYYRNYDSEDSDNLTVEHIANDNTRKWLFDTSGQ